MKKLFLTLAIMAVSVMLFANKPISVEEAQLVSKNYLTQFSGKTTYNVSDFTLVETQYCEDGTPAFYRFQIKGKGFILVSATELMYPVLALSMNTEYEQEGTKNFFSQRYVLETEVAREANVQFPEVAQSWKHFAAENFVPSASKSTGEGVQPLLTTHWAQGKYYNYNCPIDTRDADYGDHQDNISENDFRALVGCVAVTMSNYLFYHQYPAVGQGTTSYIPRDYNDETGELDFQYERQTINFEEQNYNYAEMPQGKVSTSSMENYSVIENYAGEMTKLLAHTGVSAFMGYGISASGAFSPDAYAALLRNWKMDDAGLFTLLDVSPIPSEREQDTAKIRIYQDSICASLDRRTPVAFSGGVYLPGQNVGDYECGERHAFHIDGYYKPEEGPIMFHVNMGWGNYQDGFYQFGNLNRYSCDEGVMLNILPPDSLYHQGIIKPTEGDVTVTSASGTISDGSGAFKYKPNTNRTWTIETPGATSYQIFFSRINLQNGDKLIIKDANGVAKGTFEDSYLSAATMKDAPAGVFEGLNLPNNINIEGAKFTVEFQTNGDSIVDYGFVLGYDAAIAPDGNFLKPDASFTNTAIHGFVSDKGCKGVQEGDSPEAIMAELGSDEPYQLYRSRTVGPKLGWGSERIVFSFRKFELAKGDVVEVHKKLEGPDDYQLVYAFSTENPPVDTFSVMAYDFEVRFVSDNSGAGKGFVIEYFTVALENTGIEDMASGITESKIYPNPATNVLNVFVNSTIDQDVTFQVTDIMGKVLTTEQQRVNGEYTHTLNVANLAKGMYMMNIQTEKGKSTYKFIIE